MNQQKNGKCRSFKLHNNLENISSQLSSDNLSCIACSAL